MDREFQKTRCPGGNGRVSEFSEKFHNLAQNAKMKFFTNDPEPF
jgi:hypothetical protein